MLRIVVFLLVCFILVTAIFYMMQNGKENLENIETSQQSQVDPGETEYPSDTPPSTPSPTEATQPATTISFQNLLKHLECEVDDTTSDSENNYYKCVSTEEEPRLNITHIGNWKLDFNNDQAYEEIYIYSANYGGSGTFYYAIVHNPDSTYSNPLFLGDRIQFEEGKVFDNNLHITYIGHGPNDPLCCPTQKQSGTIIYTKGSIFDIVHSASEEHSE